jgi:hypothetical protein
MRSRLDAGGGPNPHEAGAPELAEGEPSAPPDGREGAVVAGREGAVVDGSGSVVVEVGTGTEVGVLVGPVGVDVGVDLDVGAVAAPAVGGAAAVPVADETAPVELGGPLGFGLGVVVATAGRG